MKQASLYFNHKIQAFCLTLLLFLPMLFAFVEFSKNIKYKSDKSSKVLLSIKHVTLEPKPSLNLPSVAKKEEPKKEIKEEIKKPKEEIKPKIQKKPIKKPKPIKKEIKQTEPPKPQNTQNSQASSVQSSATKIAKKHEDMQVLSYGNSEDPLLKAIKMAIDKAGFYPRRARKMGLEGEVWVQFEWSKEAKLKGLKLSKKAKYEILNKNALETIIKASKNFPKPDRNIRIIVPVTYELR